MNENEMPLTYDRMVGIPPAEEHLAEVLHQHVKELQTKHNEAMLPGEIEPTLHDVEIIKQTWDKVIHYLHLYGREVDREINLSAVHIFPPGGTEAYRPGLGGGAHSAKFSSILADRDPSDVKFSLILFHEMLHLLEYNALQITAPDGEDKRKIEGYRTGFSVRSRDGKESYFDVLDEAIVGMLTKKYFDEVLAKNPEYEGDIADGDESIDTSRITEGKELHELAEDIYENNREEFGNVQEVLDLFMRSSLSGNLLPIARLVEKTYGKGSFRELGEATSYENWHKKSF